MSGKALDVLCDFVSCKAIRSPQGHPSEMSTLSKCCKRILNN